MVDLLLDSRIRDWVLFPIVIAMFFMGLLRNYVAVIMKTVAKPEETTVRQNQILARCNQLKENGNYLSLRAFRERKEIFNHKERGLLMQKVENTQMMAMMSPTNMTDMMKKNMLMVIPNIIMMTGMSWFFSGFVIAKVPFPLTGRFRAMLQQGIELSTLDVTYVTSLSLYFLFLFGMSGILSLILGDTSEADETQLMQQQMAAAQGPGAIDMAKAFKAESENLEILDHKWALNDVEQYILRL